MISEGSKRETMDFMYSEHRLNEDSSATVSESHSPSVNKCAADSPLSPSTLRHHQQDGALLALSQSLASPSVCLGGEPLKVCK